MQCSLCGSETKLYSEILDKTYFKCTHCKGILLDPFHYLSTEAEKDRYQLHVNDITDPGYQNFVSPIVNAVSQKYNAHHKGLDFGSGSGPVISYLLKKNGYNITTYDPFFNPNNTALKSTYDYIVCCEVIEHFYHPLREFELLNALLLETGTLFCKTSIYHPSIDFDAWWYKNDPTHVFFYSPDTLQWIKENFKFKTLEISDKLIAFSK
ncbi:class I SAM-dependent methyltransferase [Aquimarina mytili]|uniref:Class I SAM-dependent methyltransferase n=1 Tax=Aquimarina mytili TaxID=874423 RepID=A0A937D9G0_9FLAO|nr:class I SAM-dependent methyltransferase [Aquimarina mytili]MBL0685030.1 class I SAM-dependent methyltransferase [Aquimarina mytili]